MYLHVFKCNECRYYQTDNCPWQRTQEGNIACESFCHKIATTSWDGTVPISGFGLSLVSTAISASWDGTVPISGFGLSLVSTAISAGGPIEVG